MPRMPVAGIPGMGMPLIPNVSVPPSLASYHNSITKVIFEKFRIWLDNSFVKFNRFSPIITDSFHMISFLE